MQPKTPHWADQTAAKLIRERGDRAEYTVASGITPSGTVHIGNFREVITVDLVARALADLGKKVRFIYSWDDFDTFRKVPKNFPKQEELKKELRKPISRILDPFGEEKSYARHNEVGFETELKSIGISPEYLYQNERYGAGMYAEQIRFVLERKDDVRKILDQYRTEPLPTDWMPTSIFCESCDKDELKFERYDGEWDYSYECASCGHKATTDIRKTKNLKLLWRCDWPMRWNFEKVDFEPGGKDHSSEGGSYDTCSKIVEALWKRPPPVYLQYDFVSIKGRGGKMSSSSGELISLTDAYKVYTPQMIRWIFANQRPNHDFSLAFDEDVIKTFDEFDRVEAEALNTANQGGKWPIIRRCYEFSLLEFGKIPATPPYRPPFRALCNRLQICDGDGARVLEHFYKDEVKTADDRVNFLERCEKAWNWLSEFAPAEFCYRINSVKVEGALEPSQKKAIDLLHQLVKTTDLAAIDPTALNQKIYDDVIHPSACDSKAFFQAVYQRLISRDQGPRLPAFLKEIGQKRLLELL
jgi:lysyl-tRNA synthetase class 1